MEKDDRRLQLYAADDDLLVETRILTEGDYECVRVNSSWVEKNLFEGDVIFFTASDVADAGDIVLIDQEGSVRIGLVAEPGMMETPAGQRPMEASERIIGVAVALASRLGKRDAD
jgi:hypothetical protein